MSGPLKFAGRVVVVTGAGAGLGRSYALAFAERGASVVVNDLGGSAFGDGKSASAADKVVAEITSKGGKAVANYDSVENGDRIIKSALDSFGRVDVLVNNAGILRDKSFHKMTDDDWTKIIDVHLTGAFRATHAAWPAMRKQNFGRIIMTSSPTGLYGNFGQTNYGAAKAGLIGFAKSLAKEGEKYNIFANVVCPNAGTRLTQTVMPSDVVEALKPDYCVPLVLQLCSEDSTENGGIFETGGGWTAKVKYFRTAGTTLPLAQRTSPEALRENWQEVVDFDRSQLIASDSAMDTAQHVVNVAKAAAEQSASATQAASAPLKTGTWRDGIGRRTPPLPFSYNQDQAILYALGIGCSQSHEGEMRYLYEGDEQFSVFPTFGVIPAQDIMFRLEGIPGLPIDLTRLLHGESYLELLKPLPKSGKLVSEAIISDIVDKRSGALLILDAETKDAETGEKIAINQFVVFLSGSGGFGGPRTSEKQRPFVALSEAERSRKPDAERVEKIGSDQNAIYRLSGDKNPMHIDKNFAAIGGFDNPILHGLCSLGYATRHVMDAFSPAKFNSVKVRFSKPVLPGQTLRTRMWLRKLDGNSDKFVVLYETTVEESGTVCLSGTVTLTGSGIVGKSVAKL